MGKYDFDLIIDEKVFEENRKKHLEQKRRNYEMKMKKQKTKNIISLILFTILVVFITISIYQLFTVSVVKTTPVGNYTCNGGFIKTCNGSKAVMEYLGV